MTISVNLDIGSIVNSIVWPVLAGILLLKYRTNIGSFLKEINPRINKLSVGIPGLLSVEIENTKGLTPQWKAESTNFDFRQSGIDGFQSLAADLLSKIKETSPLDYAVFNLGDGKKWLNSRLYLFTVILHKMRHLRAIIFVDTNQGIEDHFVGFASPEQVEDALFRRYPYLAIQFANSFNNLQVNNQIDIDGLLLPSNVEYIISDYLNGIKFRPDANTPEPKPEWGYVKLGNNYWESADWLSTSKVEEILAGVIDKSKISKLELDILPKENQLKLILALEGTFVAMVDQNQKFVTLIDRHHLAEDVAQHCVHKKEEDQN